MKSSSLMGDSSQIECARRWLFDHALPLWIEHGVDKERGGVFDSLNMNSLDNSSAIKRLRVVTRQIYVFSVGVKEGVDGASDALAHGLESLFCNFRSPKGAFVSSCDLSGAVLDPTRDLYDLAFTLFSLAHAYSVRPDAVLRQEAIGVLEFICHSMRHSERGLVESIPHRLPRRQNPHMHLFEAMLACFEHFGDPVYADFAHGMAKLFEQNFFLTPGIVNEFFEDDLRTPSCQSGGLLMEPGHHFEWIWLLEEYRRLFGIDVGRAENLANFVMANGISDESNLLYGAVYGDGQVAQADVRLWPHTEWLRAAAIRPELCGSTMSVWQLIQRFLEVPIKGLWFEHWNAKANRYEGEVVPASTLYHLTSGITGLLTEDCRTERSVDE